jgi:hypothetical protein
MVQALVDKDVRARMPPLGFAERTAMVSATTKSAPRLLDDVSYRTGRDGDWKKCPTAPR